MQGLAETAKQGLGVGGIRQPPGMGDLSMGMLLGSSEGLGGTRLRLRHVQCCRRPALTTQESGSKAHD